MNRTTAAQLKKRDRFLAELLDGNTITGACQAAGLPRRTVYDWRDQDKTFADAWQTAYDRGTDLLEAEAQRRAIEGVEKPVTVAGEREVIRDFSDTLLIFLLKARRPERYRDNVRHEHTGADGGPVKVEHTRRLTLADVAEFASSLSGSSGGAGD